MRLKSLLRRLSISSATLLVVPALGAHDLITTKITWSGEVSRIVYARCLSCHQEGGAAFPLATYEQSRPWAKAIKEEVLSRRMPVWGAVKGFGNFQNDPSLSQEEISLIAQWVEGGAPEGDSALLPRLSASTPSKRLIPKGSRPEPLTQDWVATAPLSLTAIEPKAGADQTKVVAYLPDGTAIPLLWLYALPSRNAHLFVYERPVALPKGTHIRTTGPAPANITMWIRAPLPIKPSRGS